MESAETADLAELPMAVWSEADQLADSTKIKALSSDVGKILYLAHFCNIGYKLAIGIKSIKEKQFSTDKMEEHYHI